MVMIYLKGRGECFVGRLRFGATNIPGNCDKQVVNDKVLRKTGFPRETMQIYAD